MGDRKRQRRRHPHRVLSARAVQTAKGTGRLQRIADGGGLYLLVAPSGSKSWLLRTVVQGTRRDLGLGSVSLVSLAEARDNAVRLRKIARAGGDPLAQRRLERRIVPTLGEATQQVHASHAATFRNEKHRKQWIASLRDALIMIGSKPVDAITSADILAVLSPMWLQRPETSRRVLQRFRVIFDWCVAQEFCSANPTQGITKALPKHRNIQRHHAALPYADVSAFINDLRESDASELVKLALELTIVCATRTSETLNATWPEVDLDATVWTIPATRMKAGVDHRVPLAPRAVEILEQAHVLSASSPYVFTGRSRNRPLSNMALLMAVRRMGRGGITVHGFRSTFRDWAAERTNAPRAVCEAALAHTLQNKTEAAYHRTDLFERRRELMTDWAAFATATPADNVAMGAQ